MTVVSPLIHFTVTETKVRETVSPRVGIRDSPLEPHLHLLDPVRYSTSGFVLSARCSYQRGQTRPVLHGVYRLGP